MSRRNRNRPPISLFAFQDIITSLSGVIIFMVLTLTLELVNRRKAAESTVSSDLAAKLDATIKATRSEIESLRPNVAAQSNILEAASAASPAGLHTDIESLDAQSKALRDEIRSLEVTGRRLVENAKSVEVEKYEQRGEREERDRLRKRAELLQQDLQSELRDNRLVYALPRGIQKNGWMVVVDGHTVSVAPLGRRERPRSFFDKRQALVFTSKATDQFLNWAGDLDAGSAYFFVLARPTGIETFRALEVEFESRGYLYGFDVCGEGQEVLHLEFGAGE